jgi:hypothetical protein
MSELMKFYGRSLAGDVSSHLGTFRYDASRPARGGCFSRDLGALFVPELRVEPCIVRQVANGGTLFAALNGVCLLQQRGDRQRFQRWPWSYCWGDLMVFETGEQVVRRAIFLRGVIEVPDLNVVSRYLQEMPKPS